MTATLEDTRTSVQDRAAAASWRMASALEAVAVLASPVILYRLLRLRGMSPPQLPDPSMHTTFILDPHDIFLRYQAWFEPTSRLREAARVGFLVPARLSYLLFGALPGFFVFRYVLALIVIGPLYLLLKRLYGRWAGFVGIAVAMSSPVLVTAWGTDYPDSAAVSYLIGGLAAFALSLQPGRWRTAWMLVAGGLLTMTVWTHGVAVPLVIVMIVVYVGVRFLRERARLVRDLALLAATAIVVTGLLAIFSKLLIGQFNFISPTLKSAQQLSSAYELSINHSSSSKWAIYDPYLLVPPAIVLAYFLVFARRWRDIGTSQLFIGLAGALSLAAFAYLQFLGTLQTLEMHFFSTTLWSSVTFLLAMTVAEVMRPMLAGRGGGTDDAAPSATRALERAKITRWILAAVPGILVLAVAIAYEINPYVMSTTWGGGAGVVAAIVVVAAGVGRLVIGSTESSGRRRGAATIAAGAVSSAAVVAIVGGTLLLTVAKPTAHVKLAHTVYNPYPDYSGALNGSETPYIASYAVDAKVPGFVGPAAYRGEVLLTWEPPRQFGDLLGPMGLYHNAYTWVSPTFPVLSAGGARKVKAVRAAQVLMMSETGAHFARAVRSLAPFRPVVIRRTVISYGSLSLHAWLVDLERYIRRT